MYVGVDTQRGIYGGVYTHRVDKHIYEMSLKE